MWPVLREFEAAVRLALDPLPDGLPAIVCNNCSYWPFATVLAPQCSPVFLLVLVASRVEAADLRHAVRATYAQGNSSVDFRLFFVVGYVENTQHNQAIVTEHQKYNDIIKFDFLDTYDNLTLKSKLALRWAHLNCPKTQYIIKTDVDIYNNMPLIYNFIKTSALNSITGYCLVIPIAREKSSPYYIPYAMYPHSISPVYCTGALYIIPGTMLGRIVATSNNVRFYPFEDVYITGLVRSVAGLPYRQMPGCGFTIHNFKYLSASARQRITNFHKVKPEDMKMLWEYFTKH